MLFHVPFSSDDAIPALMASQIRDGHFYTFYWGQPYGGVEPYLVALITWISPRSPTLVNVVPAILLVGTSVLTWRVVRRLVPAGMETLAVLAGAAVWAGTEAMQLNVAHEYGFRGVTLVAGPALLLLALRVRDAPSTRDLAAVGLVAGIGWWSSPEIVYFAIPALGAIGVGWLRRFPWSLAAAPVGFVVGAAPWLYTNLRSGFASLRGSSSVRTTYRYRIHLFVRDLMPMSLGERLSRSGEWIDGFLGHAVYLALVVLLLASVVALLAGLSESSRRTPLRALALGVIAYPFWFAVFPQVWQWQGGQYGMYFTVLAVIAMTAAAGSVYGRWRPTAGAVAALSTAIVFAVPLVLVLALISSKGVPGATGDSLTAGWDDQNRAAQTIAEELVDGRVTYAWANYWVAYQFDYLTGDKLMWSEPQDDRWVGEFVLDSRHPSAYVFYQPRIHVAALLQGPANWSEGRFLAVLERQHVGYTATPVFPLVVVQPDRPVDPADVGMPPPIDR